MAINQINNLSRDFDSVKNDIIAYSRSNYSQLSENFGNDGSVGEWIIDLLSECVDSLNYHIDRTYQDTLISTSNSRKALMNIARANGIKVPGAKAGMCEVQFSCMLPVNPKDISQPNWTYAPVIQRNCVVGAGNLTYTIDENVDFAEQFNSDAFSNRTYEARRNANGDITNYIVTKSVVATAGVRRVYKKILNDGDVNPFMEIILPDVDVLNVESVIFKASSDINTTPEINEYYVDSEEYQFKDSALTTYRFFEVDALSDQWRWGIKSTNIDDGVITDRYQPDSYQTTYSGSTFVSMYRGGWKPIRQKFITEFTDNGYMKLIFGAGADYDNPSISSTNYANYRMSEVYNNDLLGVLPKVGWTMYVLYNVGGGVNTNVAQGAINTINSMQVDFPHTTSIDNQTRSNILRSMSVTNRTPSMAGKDAPSNEELKNMIKYHTASQERCITVKDYEDRVMQMPPKFGAPFRCAAIEENNKIVINMLGMNSNGTLQKAIPSTLADNIVDYLSHYKSIGDYVELKSGKIYNIGFLIDTFIDKSYNAADVIASIIRTAKEYMDVNKHTMGKEIFLGDLYKEISTLDGVYGIIDLKVYKITGGTYSPDKCPLPSIDDNQYSDCNTVDEPEFKLNDLDATAERIDIDAVDSVLLGDNNAMYEVKNPELDIKVRVKQK